MTKLASFSATASLVAICIWASSGGRPQASTVEYISATARITRAFAEQGSAEAQFLLGRLYTTGRGGSADFTEAVGWYRKAAEQGNRDAEFWLAIMYDRGSGVSHNLVQAANWYRRAAQDGLAAAQLAISIRYSRGIGVPRDDAIAARWMYRAAMQGIPEAQLALAQIFASGAGVPKDSVAAFTWATIALKNLPNENQRTEANRLSQQVVGMIPAGQIAQTQYNARDWRPAFERPHQPIPVSSIHANGILASLNVSNGIAVVTWRFDSPSAASINDIRGTIDGQALGIPRLEAYPQPGAKTSVLLLLDVTGPGRNEQIHFEKSVLADIAGHAKEDNELDVAVYAATLQLLVPSKTEIGALLELAKAAPTQTAPTNLGQVLQTAIEIPSSTPVDRRGIFVLTDGHSDDSLNVNGLIESAKRNRTSLNFIVSEGHKVDLPTLKTLADATGGLLVDQDQLADFLQAPLQLLDSGATVRFPLGHLALHSTAEPEVRIILEYGNAPLELKAKVVNKARLELEGLEHVIQSCDASCKDDFKQQVQDRIALIQADEKTYESAKDDPKSLRKYVSECRICTFRREAEVRAKALGE